MGSVIMSGTQHHVDKQFVDGKELHYFAPGAKHPIGLYNIWLRAASHTNYGISNGASAHHRSTRV
jgi:hypothetical protein